MIEALVCVILFVVLAIHGGMVRGRARARAKESPYLSCLVAVESHQQGLNTLIDRSYDAPPFSSMVASAQLSPLVRSYGDNLQCYRGKTSMGEWVLLDFEASELVLVLDDRPLSYSWLLENSSIPRPARGFSAGLSDAPVEPGVSPTGARLHFSLWALDASKPEAELARVAAFARALESIDVDEALGVWHGRFMAGEDRPHPDDGKALALLAGRGDAEAVQAVCARVIAHSAEVSPELCLEALRRATPATGGEPALATAWTLLKRAGVQMVIQAAALEIIAEAGGPDTASQLIAWASRTEVAPTVRDAVDEAVMKLSFRHDTVAHQEGQLSLAATDAPGQLSLPAADGAVSLDIGAASVSGSTVEADIEAPTVETHEEVVQETEPA